MVVFQGSSLLASAVLVFVCCCRPADEALRLAVLGSAVSGLDRHPVALAEVRGWREAMSACRLCNFIGNLKEALVV